MSAAKMVADSTQGDVPEMSSSKKRKKMVQKKKLKKKKESTKKSKKKIQHQQEEVFDDSDLDLDKEIHPIGYYVKDRENLLTQMFHCVKGQSLNRALPDVLKDLPFEDLRQRCMEQLEVMSKKRIRRIFAGDDTASISSSSTEDETSDEEIIDLEEGQVGEDQCEDSNIVDSTSYTLEVGDSDRELDEGSVGRDSLYGNYSDEEQDFQHQYDDEYEAADGSDQDVAMETEFIENQPESDPSYPPGTPEEPEEGEVIDDNSESGEVSNDNVVKTDIKQESNIPDNSEESSKTHSNEDNSDTGTPVSNVEICEASNESENVTANAEKAKETDNNDDKEDDSKPVNVDVKIEDGNNAEDLHDNVTDTDKIEQLTVNVDLDVRIVNKEIAKTDKDKEGSVPVTNDGSDKTDNAGMSSEEVVEEDVTSIKAAESDGEFSDEGNIEEAEVEKEEPAKAECSTSTLIVSDVKKGKPARRVVKPPQQDIAPALTKNQMELLELEMRARAIKAMLKTAK